MSPVRNPLWLSSFDAPVASPATLPALTTSTDRRDHRAATDHCEPARPHVSLLGLEMMRIYHHREADLKDYGEPLRGHKEPFGSVSWGRNEQGSPAKSPRRQWVRLPKCCSANHLRSSSAARIGRRAAKRDR
jgi:hypothetical protein